MIELKEREELYIGEDEEEAQRRLKHFRRRVSDWVLVMKVVKDIIKEMEDLTRMQKEWLDYLENKK